MTQRQQDLYLLAVMKQRLQDQQQHALAVTAGVGALLSKESSKAHEELDKLRDGYEKLQYARVGGKVPEGEEAIQTSPQAEGSTPAAPAAPAAPPRGSTWVDLSDAQKSTQAQQDIRKLDTIMTVLTGQPTKNPAGGYGAGQGLTSFDVSNRSVGDILGSA